MTVLLVTGVMELGVMATIAGAITIERLAPSPGRIARTIGVAIIAMGAFAVVHAFGRA
jgi:predicted metal-binding membrane protein